GCCCQEVASNPRGTSEPEPRTGLYLGPVRSSLDSQQLFTDSVDLLVLLALGIMVPESVQHLKKVGLVTSSLTKLACSFEVLAVPHRPQAAGELHAYGQAKPCTDLAVITVGIGGLCTEQFESVIELVSGCLVGGARHRSRCSETEILHSLQAVAATGIVMG